MTSSDRYAVIGNPIDFSKSPMIHSEFARATGQSIEYTKILGPIGEFDREVDAFRASGGKGLNVTAPFKLDAYRYAHEHSASARIAGAVNALKFEGDRVLGENFDGVGLVRDVVHNLGHALRGRRVLLLGSGGAARGALLPFIAEQPAELLIVNRTLSRARELAEIGQQRAGPATSVRAAAYEDLGASPFDIVFNATSASLRGELPPVPATVFSACALAYELAYAKGMTPFLQTAKSGGARALADGVGMLAEQAAEAFAWWRGVRPQTATVIEQLRVPLT